MKKFTLIIVAVVFATTAYSQNFEWGVKAGLNLAVETNGSSDTGSRAGLVAGVFMEFPVTPNIGIQPELVYSMQGASTKDGSSTLVDKLDYINLPVIAKFYLGERRFSIDAGLQFGYMISAKIKHSSGTQDIMEFIDNRFDVALGLGVSYKFAERFDASFRYNIGMIKLVDGMDNRNGVTQLTIGYRF